MDVAKRHCFDNLLTTTLTISYINVKQAKGDHSSSLTQVRREHSKPSKPKQMKMNKLYLIFIMLFSYVVSVEIHELNVPKVVEEGSENIILDCNFNYKESEADQLEVKWYFNQDPAPFCQWIAGRSDSKPQLSGSLFVDKVDLSYTSGSNNHTKYRVLLFHNHHHAESRKRSNLPTILI